MIWRCNWHVHRIVPMGNEALLIPQMCGPILLFDGYCPFCNFVVRMIYRLDRSGTILFAPIESERGRAVIERHPEVKALDSAFLLEHDEYGTERISAKSDMLARLADYIAWPGKLLLLPFKIIPCRIGDLLYDQVARNRNRLFGRYESCPLPSRGLRDRFISNHK
ncbi:MAG TPA: DCC1-like thiol-disulfide oxidoreductase family protein [Candidatus Kapabacteria bacterium]|nr:DCC1-like thiol-disulfide oxidoreductase family protein [Candidatus Kapabacteria bacterium]